MTDRDHRHYMQRAIALANSVLFITDPNPRVGCVLVCDNTIVGEGATSSVGGPHAEINALHQAGERARGATAYVTLEPCCHHGRTPPCTDALIEAGVRDVVAPMVDPNPQVAGHGFEALKAAGISVTLLPDYAPEARMINPGFIRRMQGGLPWVRVKIAASLDGRTALLSGESQWITGTSAREDVHYWRARSSAIITGRGTISDDDARLSARVDESVVQPLRVIMTTSANVSEDAAVLDPPQSWLIVASRATQTTQDVWRARGIECIGLAPDDTEGVDPLAVLQELARRDVNEVWVEAGARLAGRFISKGAVDELIVYLAPKLLGANARAMALIDDPNSLSDALTFSAPKVKAFGDDVRLIYSVREEA